MPTEREAEAMFHSADVKDIVELIPVIKCRRHVFRPAWGAAKVAAEVGKASREIGFSYAQNHSMTGDTVTKSFEAV